MFQPRWGDLPLIPDTESGIAAIEREQITKPRPVEVEGAPLHQPSREITTSTSLPAEYSSVDCYTLHTVKLLQYAKKLRSLIQSLQQQSEAPKNNENDATHVTSALPMPEFPDGMMISHRPGDIKDKSKEESEFFQGRKKYWPELSPPVVRQLLRKSVAALCAHVGYDTTTETVLDTLTDILHAYYQRIGRTLRAALDREALTGSTGFVDVLEQTFHEMGLGSITSMHHFYQRRIVSYHSHVLQVCHQLMAEYDRLKTPEPKPPEEVKSVKVKEEPLSDIQFPVLEEFEEVQVQTPIQLEELQGALQSMESEGSTSLKDEDSMWKAAGKKEGAQFSTPSLDPDDEVINISDSPPTSSGEIDISQGIPSVSVSETMSPPLPPPESVRIGKPPKKKKKK